MKLRNFLYISSGLITSICGAVISFFSIIPLLLGGLVKTLFESSYELVEGFVTEMAKADSKYEYLLDYSKAEAIDYVVKVVRIVCLVFLIIGILNLVFGIINIRLRNSHDRVFAGKTWKKVVFVVFAWLINGLNLISSVATTVAVFLKVSNTQENKLYSVNDN